MKSKMLCAFEKLTCFLAAALSASALSACAVTPSSNVKTSGLFVQFSVSGDSAATANAQAIFQVGNELGTFVILSDGDAVTCNGQPMSESSIMGYTTYNAAVTYQPGSTYTFVFTRPNEQPYTATARLPDPVSITAPASGATLTRGQAIPVSWTQGQTATDSIEVQLIPQNSGNAGDYSELLSSDPGTFTIPGGVTQAPAQPASDATLKVTRSRSGTPAVGLQGTVSASQSQSIQVVLQ